MDPEERDPHLQITITLEETRVPFGFDWNAVMADLQKTVEAHGLHRSSIYVGHDTDE